jgi:hypothetical protein
VEDVGWSKNGLMESQLRNFSLVPSECVQPPVVDAGLNFARTPFNRGLCPAPNAVLTSREVLLSADRKSLGVGNNSVVFRSLATMTK